jgi:hypothetical protein
MKRTSFSVWVMLSMTFVLNSVVEVKAQDEESSPFSAGADFMSRYVWRGLDYGGAPSIQPCLEFSTGGFAIGAWGAYTTAFAAANDKGVQEMDLYATYTFADIFTVGVTDYFFPQESDYNYNYFDYGSDSSAHVLEGMVSFNGLEGLPLSLLVGVNLVNDDDNSVYFELGYSLSVLDLFIGAGNGVYTSEGGFVVVNVGISSSKEIPITENFSLPVSASLITNPDAKQIHLVFGISL